jgi:hypothetical protein
MKCPHCSMHFHDHWTRAAFSYLRNPLRTAFGLTGRALWQYQITVCSNCMGGVIEIAPIEDADGKKLLEEWRMVYPIVGSRGPVSPEVPADIAGDYREACDALPISPKASAALSRRCLQNILHTSGYKGRDLAAEIDLLFNEVDPKKAIPQRLRATIDAIRNFGNFGAHPINDKTTLQIIDVEPHEAESCLDILEECFEHFYVGPAVARARRVALDAKLAAAGKPPLK